MSTYVSLFPEKSSAKVATVAESSWQVVLWFDGTPAHLSLAQAELLLPQLIEAITAARMKEAA